MLSYEVVGDGRAPHPVRTVAWTVLALLSGWTSVVFSPVGWRQQETGAVVWSMLFLLALVVGAALTVALWWRHRHPLALVMASSLASVLLPIGIVLPLLACSALIGRRRGSTVWAAAGLVGLTSAWVVWADHLAQPAAASVEKKLLGPEQLAASAHHTVPNGVPVLVLVLGWAVTVSLGMMVRARRAARVVEREVATTRSTAERLGDEAARRQEREQIAREVHDVLGHRLSLLILHAGALEVNAGADTRLAESARLVRESATAAVDDLRSLLAVLREPVREAAVYSLTELPRIIQESFGAGQQINSTVFIAEADRADPALARAVYRIVQELLTNARKHAAAEAVFLDVHGSPADGITIEAHNRLPTGARAPEPGQTRGLAGIAERAELLGGSVAHGVEAGYFRVRVTLPWRGGR